jgi:N-acyl-D-amino-acid deacylase
MALDTLIKNGRAVDGRGNPFPYRPWEPLDIGIKDGKIVMMRSAIDMEADHVIDAAGQIGAPGSSDVHSHSDGYLMENPRAESSVRQGITTCVVGNCGLSAAPIYNGFRPASSILPGKIPYTWTTMDEYFQVLERSGLSLNMIALVGHCNLRAAGMNFRQGKPGREELDFMRTVLRESLDAGCWGMSVGLIYPPAYFSGSEELVEMLKIVAEYNGVHHVHVRGQGENLIAAIQEAIAVSGEAGSSVHIHHHKGMGDSNAPKIKYTLQLLEDAMLRGIRVSMDMYPYQMGQGGLGMFLPSWASDDGLDALVERLKDRAVRKRLKLEMTEPSLLPGYQSYVRDLGPKCFDHFIICECQQPKNKKYAGKSINRAKPDGMDPFDFIFDLLIDERGDVPVVIPDVIDLDDTYLQMVLRHPGAVFGSDGYALATYGVLGEGNPHPRSYGAFPRVLGNFVRERRLFTWHEAIRKMTSLPAQLLGMTDRGVLAEEMIADIMIFDPETIIDRSTLEDPHQYPEGMNYVLTRGVLVVANGDHTGALPGGVLRKKR